MVSGATGIDFVLLVVAADEGVRLFLQQVGELPREDRMILIHCGLEGLTHAETATRLGSPATPSPSAGSACARSWNGRSCRAS